MFRLPILVIITGLTAICASILFSSNNPTVFINIPGLSIILGGISTALFFSYSMTDIKQAIQKVHRLFNDVQIDKEQAIKHISDIAQLWVRNDLRAIENKLESLDNRFLQTGIQHIIDRRPSEEIISVLSWKIQQLRNSEYRITRIFHSMAMFAPAFGMVGTLLGLVNMMFLIDDQSNASIASHLAIALVTTFYGLVLANLLFKPIAIKLERRADKMIEWMGIMLEGIMMIEQRKSPAFILHMMSILDPYQKNDINTELASRRIEPALNAP